LECLRRPGREKTWDDCSTEGNKRKIIFSGVPCPQAAECDDPLRWEPGDIPTSQLTGQRKEASYYGGKNSALSEAEREKLRGKMGSWGRLKI